MIQWKLNPFQLFTFMIGKLKYQLEKEQGVVSQNALVNMWFKCVGKPPPR